MGPKSYILVHLGSIRAVATVGSMEVGTYHVMQGPES